MNPTLQMCLTSVPAERKDDLPQLAGNASANATLDVIGPLCCKGTLLADVQP